MAKQTVFHKQMLERIRSDLDRGASPEEILATVRQLIEAEAILNAAGVDTQEDPPLSLGNGGRKNS